MSAPETHSCQNRFSTQKAKSPFSRNQLGSAGTSAPVLGCRTRRYRHSLCHHSKVRSAALSVVERVVSDGSLTGPLILIDSLSAGEYCLVWCPLCGCLSRLCPHPLRHRSWLVCVQVQTCHPPNLSVVPVPPTLVKRDCKLTLFVNEVNSGLPQSEDNYLFCHWGIEWFPNEFEDVSNQPALMIVDTPGQELT